MQSYILIGGGLLILLLGFVVGSNFRFIQTIYLITQASPYTQSGNGAGSILVIGDSTGYGTGVRDATESIAGRIGADFPTYRIENSSHNGDTVAKASARLDELTQSYDLILLQLGANDILQKRDISSITADIETLYTKLREHSDQIVMMSLGDVGAVPAFTGEEAARYSEQSAAYHTALEAFVAEQADFSYVNLYEEPRTDPFIQAPEMHIAADGLHPTAAGYGVWYAKLRPILQAILGNY